MKTYRWGNADIQLNLSSKEFSQLEKLTEKKEFASSKLKTQFPGDPLRNKTIVLIYDPIRHGSCGVDTTEIISNLNKNKIPIYLSKRAIDLLREDSQVGSAYLYAKVIIKLDK
jgi:hypothetical protein